MPIGLGTRRGRAVTLEEGASPKAARCPACGEPLFVWLEIRLTRVAPASDGLLHTEHPRMTPSDNGPREDQLIDRCENCGLVVARDSVPSPDAAVEQLLAGATRRGERTCVRAQNSASLQAWLGAENWAALAPGGAAIKPTQRAAALLLARRGMDLRRVRHLAGPGMASMWQTLLNLLTFHRDFASQAASGRLRPGSGRGMAAFWIDAMVTVLAAVPTAALAVLLETGAVITRHGGVIEIEAEPLPPTS
jgi:hypothetical protein